MMVESIRPTHGIQQGTQDDYYENSERINPIFCMKGIMGLHVVSFFSPVERIKTRAQVARVYGECGRWAPEADFADVGQPTTVWQLRRTERAVSEQKCSLE